MNIGSTHALNGAFEVQAMSVIVAQMASLPASSYSDVDKNVDHIIEFMDRASFGYAGYDLFLTPECVLQGSAPNIDDVILTFDSPQIERLKCKCRELKVWGVFTGSFEYEGLKPCNMSFMINDTGEVVHKYMKMNTFVPFETHYPGWEMTVTEGPKGSRIATIICADGDYPEMWREAAYNGANIILRPSRYMSPWDYAWEITNKACAYCNNIYVVACNAVGIDNGFTSFGNSMILGPDGNIICKASLGSEWLLKADLYPQIIDQMRKKSTTHNFLYAFRHRGGTHMAFQGTGDERIPYKAYEKPGQEEV